MVLYCNPTVLPGWQVQLLQVLNMRLQQRLSLTLILLFLEKSGISVLAQLYLSAA